MKEMTTSEAINEMLAEAGRNACDVSRSLGRSQGYVGTIANYDSRSVPRVNTLVQIADELGYDLVLTSKDGKESIRVIF